MGGGGSNSKKYEYEFQILGVRSYFFVFFRIFYQNFFTLEITKYPREMDL